MQTIKAVIIDLDDTFVLTEAACFEMENTVLEKMGKPRMPREVHLQTWGKALFDALPMRSPGTNVEEFKKVFNTVIKEFTASGKLDAISKENTDALDELIRQGKTLLVLTSREHVELEHMLEPDHLLASRVKTFYYRDNMQFHKPDPRAFEQLLKDHNLKPSECVYIGDSVTDAEAAKKARLHFIASLESGLREKSAFDGHAVDVFVQKFPELVAAVNTIESLSSPI